MDARQFNGADDRDDEFAPDPIERCRVCGADAEDDCAADCCCQACDFARDVEAERRHKALVEDGETFRGGEAAAFDRDVQDVLQRTLK